MIEKVARAICENLFGGWQDEDKNNEFSPEGQCMLAAKAAITAMREPTEKMGIAGAKQCCDECTGITGNIKVYQSMIDAALKDE